MYFIVSQKDSLANPYSAQLVLDEDTKQRHEKYLVLQEDLEKIKNLGSMLGSEYNFRNTQSENIYDDSTRQESHERFRDKKKTIIEDILRTQPDDDGDNIEKSKRDMKDQIKHVEYLQSFSFDIPRNLETTGKLSHKIHYLMDEALSDIGLRNILSTDFWISVLVLLVAIWIRAYLHSFGSWLYLMLFGINISTITPMMYVPRLILDRYGIKVEYAATSATHEIGSILIGNLFNTFVFTGLVLLTRVLQQCVDHSPALFYKFISSYGIATTFDGLLLAVMDITLLVT